MDVLGDILRVIRLQGSVYFNACFCSPWGMALENSARSAFHLVVQGEAWLSMASLPGPRRLAAGDIVFFPRGTAHSIAERADSKCLPGSEVVTAYREGRALFAGASGDEVQSNILCGYVEFDRSLSHPFLEQLPELIHISAEQRHEFHWLDAVINQIVWESSEQRPGSEVLIDKFTEVLFIQIIRCYAGQQSAGEGYLAALTDRQLSRALSLIHDNPERDWTVEQLAGEVGMSRSAFYGRFKSCIGEPPMTYLYQWRMLQARQKIEHTKKSMSLVAEEVGYQSDSAFQKAFKRFFNRTPASLRKPKSG